jgi:hypothetical protein
MATRTFDFNMVVQDMKTKMSGKLHFVSNFNVFSSLVSNFKFQVLMSFLIFFLFVVDVLWTSYGSRVPNLKRNCIWELSKRSNLFRM